METIRKINNDLTIAGQVTSEQLKQLVEEGFKSVINLRSPDEKDFLNSEQQQSETLGLYYVNIPVKLGTISDEIIINVVNQIDKLPKPILVHCDNAMRSAALVLIHIAMRQGLSLKQAFNRADQLGLFRMVANKL